MNQATNRKFKIVAIGDLTLDLIMPVKFPIEANDSIEVPWHQAEPGGVCNFLIAGQRLCGARSDYSIVGPLGDDLYGRYTLDILNAEQVGTQGVFIAPRSVSTVVLVTMEPGTGRFTYIWRGGKGDIMPITDTTRQQIDEADALFMQGYTMCEPQNSLLLDYLFSASRPIWLDVGPSIEGTTVTQRETVRRHAYAIISTEDELPRIAEHRTGDDACKFLLDCGIQLLIIKRGAQGCRLLTPLNEVVDVPAFNVDAQDLVGAGDCFNSMIITASLRGLPLYERGLLANAAGAAKVQKLGTGRSMPYPDEVQSILDRFKVPITL